MNMARQHCDKTCLVVLSNMMPSSAEVKALVSEAIQTRVVVVIGRRASTSAQP